MTHTWSYGTALTGSQNKIVEVGLIGSGITIANCINATCIALGFIADQNTNILIEGCLDNTFGVGTFDVMHTINATAGNYFTVYDAATPVGDTGAIVFAAPFVRMRLINQSATPTTYTRFFARIW
jgi:hypothetical protein